MNNDIKIYDKIYCYPNSKVLKNKKGILDQSELLDYERERSLARLVTLSKMLLEEKIPK